MTPTSAGPAAGSTSKIAIAGPEERTSELRARRCELLNGQPTLNTIERELLLHYSDRERIVGGKRTFELMNKHLTHDLFSRRCTLTKRPRPAPSRQI